MLTLFAFAAFGTGPRRSVAIHPQDRMIETIDADQPTDRRRADQNAVEIRACAVNVAQVTTEDDSVHGFVNLHTIRPKITPFPSQWRKVLGDFADKYGQLNKIWF